MAPLTTAEDYRSAFMKAEQDSRKDGEITRLIGVATAMVARATGRVMEEQEVTRSFAGEDAVDHLNNGTRTVLHMPVGDRFVLNEAGKLFTVTESGVSLTVGSGYDLTSKAIIWNLNTDERCSLYRSAGWAPGNGLKNIDCTYTCGWTDQTVPDDVKQLLFEMVFRLFNTPAWHEAGKAKAWEKQLSPPAQATLSQLRVFG